MRFRWVGENHYNKSVSTKKFQYLGCCESSKESIGNLLSLPTKGHALCIVVGGASEALGANPGHYDILMSRRKGFVKIAIKYG